MNLNCSLKLDKTLYALPGSADQTDYTTVYKQDDVCDGDLTE